MSNCDTCVNYIYDDEWECNVCLVNLDEDELGRFMAGSFSDCPYYRLDDEYLIARKQ